MEFLIKIFRKRGEKAAERPKSDQREQQRKIDPQKLKKTAEYIGKRFGHAIERLSER